MTINPLKYMRLPSLPDKRTLLIRVAWALGAIAVIVPVFYAGFRLRQWTWEYVRPIRYQADIRNAYDWGSFVVNNARLLDQKFAGPVTWKSFYRAYRDSYARADENLPFAQSELNYPPLRYLVMSLWVKNIANTTPLLMVKRVARPIWPGRCCGST